MAGSVVRAEIPIANILDLQPLQRTVSHSSNWLVHWKSTLVIATDNSAMETTANRGIVVISGGSAANNLVEVFDALRESKNCLLSYIIPISDNGGSSSELIRIFGGPGIGDVRSERVHCSITTLG